MILKWLITGFIVFSIYRFFIKPKMVPPPQTNNEPLEGEFIDYEEVE